MINDRKKSAGAIFQNVITLPDFNMHIYTLLSNEDVMHFHKVLEIGICISGSGKSEVAGREESFEVGDIMVAFPFQHHINRTDNRTGECVWQWTFIDVFSLGKATLDAPSGYLNIIEDISVYGVIKKEREPKIHDALKAVFDAAQMTDAKYKKEKLHAALTLALITMSEHSGDGTVKLPKNFHAISASLEYIGERIRGGTIPTVSDLTHTACIAPSSYRRIFGEIMGISPKEYIINCAIEFSLILLLSTDKSITEIASEVGFNEISTFGRAFKARIGCAPKEFKEKNKKLI